MFEFPYGVKVPWRVYLCCYPMGCRLLGGYIYVRIPHWVLGFSEVYLCLNTPWGEGVLGWKFWYLLGKFIHTTHPKSWIVTKFSILWCDEVTFLAFSVLL